MTNANVPGFEEALEKAIARRRRRVTIDASISLVIGLPFLVAGAMGGVPQALALGGVSVLVGVLSLVFRRPGALTRLRGSTPTLWAPSPSHGLIAVAGEWLLAGSFAAVLDRNARYRVTSVSYDEEKHALQLQTFREHQSERNREEIGREYVKLDASVTPERGFALAKEMLALTTR